MNLTSERKYRIGTVLIWLGVLAWGPYLLLLATGNRVSMLPYLGVHLLGVLGGARLRSRARGQEAAKKAKSSRMQKLSHALILIGIWVWAPYFYLHYVINNGVAITPFLIVHLTGVIGGGLLRLNGYLKEKP